MNTLDDDCVDDFSDGLDISGPADSGNALELNVDVVDTVNKVRRIVKIFKRSPLKNEILQKHVRELYPNGLNMILDCKTRWSSLVNMLNRLLQIKVPTQKALLDIDQGIYFTDEEFTLISSIVEALNPIKLAVEALCRRDTNLITAEATIKFLLDDIHKSKSHFHKQILESINQRIVQESYMDASVILQYLHNPSAKLEKKSIVRNFCANLLTRILQEDEEFPISEEGITESQSSEVTETEYIPLAKKLQLAIDASMRIPQNSLSPDNANLPTMLKY